MSTHSRLPRLTRSSSKITNAHNPFFPSRAKRSAVQFVGQVLLRSPGAFPSISLRMNIYKNGFHNSFRINTYKKEGEGGTPSRVTAHTTKGVHRPGRTIHHRRTIFFRRGSRVAAKFSSIANRAALLADHHSYDTARCLFLASQRI